MPVEPNLFLAGSYLYHLPAGIDALWVASDTSRLVAWKNKERTLYTSSRTIDVIKKEG
jgi:hypothetical protein